MNRVRDYISGNELFNTAFEGDVDGPVVSFAQYRRLNGPKLGAVSIATNRNGRRAYYMRVEAEASMLDERQRELMRYLVWGLLNDHRVPNLTDIEVQCGYSGPGDVSRQLDELERLGFIERPHRPESKRRFVRILRHPCGRPFQLRCE